MRIPARLATTAALFMAAAAGAAKLAPVYGITLVTDRAPDFTDIASYLKSVTGQFATPQEQAVNIWRWSHRLRKQASVAVEDGEEVLDPILQFTSYGHGNCGIISAVNDALWLNMGWGARYVQLGDHTVSECSWDGGKSWHMFDDSMGVYCLNDRGQVASVDEIALSPRYYLRRFCPECATNPVRDMNDQAGWRVLADHPVDYQRTLAKGMESFLPAGNELDEDLGARWGRSFAITLRPHASYTRWFRPLGEASADPRFCRLTEGRDVPGGFGVRANGVWSWAPDLSRREEAWSDSGVTWTSDGIRGPGQVTWKIDAANVATSARITATATGVSFEVSRDAGITWKPAGTDPNVGGVTEYMVRAVLAGRQSRLSALSIETVTQINLPSLPRLGRGVNRIRLRAGPQEETVQFAPSVTGGNHARSAFEARNVAANPHPYYNVASVRASAPGTGWLTWKIETPGAITAASVAGTVVAKADGDRVRLLHSWDGKTWEEDLVRAADRNPPFDHVERAEIARVPAESRAVFFRYEFECAGLSWGAVHAPGIETALMTVRHRPRSTGSSPVEVTWCWIEHGRNGDAERRHTEVVTAMPHDYTIETGGYRDPTMLWLRMNLSGDVPGPAPAATAGSMPTAGSGGDRVTSTPAATRFTWGANLALGRTYTLVGRQDDRNPDAGHDLTDGVIAPPDNNVTKRWMATNVIFAPDVSPVAVIDLGEAKEVAAVRVHAGQSAGLHVTYPDSVAVEASRDGRSWTPAGRTEWTQVFDPPWDFEDWERADDPKYAGLPAGGRLVFGYRIVLQKPLRARYARVACACRKGWSVMLSEIGVYDSVRAEMNLPAPVFLP